MKFYYPKFLKKGPNFVGLSILDLVILIIALLVSVFINLTSLQSLMSVLLAITVSKLVALKFPRGHFQHYFFKRSILHWQKELNKLSQGIFI